jgi:hypothetical protein
VGPFQNCVRQSRPPFKMATVWLDVGITGQNFGRGPSKNHFSSLVDIGSVVSEEEIFFKFHPPFFLICIIGQNRQKFKVHKVPGWVPFKFVSDSPALHSRWPLLLKIEISSNGQNCSILSQNVPKFELYNPFFLICIIGQNRQKFKVHKKSCHTC